MSEITIVGNLVADPELRFTATGTPVASFRVAENHKSKLPDGTEREDVIFWSVSAWRSLGENVAESISKGDRVIVRGRLRERSWEAEDGTRRSKVDIAAYNVGPDLSFATAQVVRNERRVPATVGASTNGHSAPDIDEEPF